LLYKNCLSPFVAHEFSELNFKITAKNGDGVIAVIPPQFQESTRTILQQAIYDRKKRLTGTSTGNSTSSPRSAPINFDNKNTSVPNQKKTESSPTAPVKSPPVSAPIQYGVIDIEDDDDDIAPKPKKLNQ